MVFDTSAAEILDRSLKAPTYQAVTRQLSYAFLGIMMGVMIFLLGSTTCMRWSFYLLVGVTLLLAAVFVPGLGQARNGAHRWVGIGAFTIQPSEFAKVILPLYALHFLHQHETTLKNFIKLLAILALPSLLIFLEPDNGSCAIIGATLAVVFWVSRLPLKYWLVPMVLVLLVGGVAALQLPYVRHRLAVYANPELDLLGRGHQPYQAKIATGSGGLLGRGVGQSMQKLTYLPEAQNDYIAAIFAEECGFVGTFTLILLYALIALFGFWLAYRAASERGRQLAVVMAALLSLQAFVNLGVVCGLVPSTGLNLPFFSQGGSSLIANIGALALLLGTRCHRVSHA